MTEAGAAPVRLDERVPVFVHLGPTGLLNFGELRFSIFRATHQHHADESNQDLEEPGLVDEGHHLDQTFRGCRPGEEGQAIEHREREEHGTSDEHQPTDALGHGWGTRHAGHAGQQQDAPFRDEHEIGSRPRAEFPETVALAEGFEMKGNVADAASGVRHPNDVEFRGWRTAYEHGCNAAPLDVHPRTGRDAETKQCANPATPLAHAGMSGAASIALSASPMRSKGKALR